MVISGDGFSTQLVLLSFTLSGKTVSVSENIADLSGKSRKTGKSRANTGNSSKNAVLLKLSNPVFVTKQVCCRKQMNFQKFGFFREKKFPTIFLKLNDKQGIKS